MTLQCRTCGSIIYNTNAKNIFDVENSEILLNIKMVVGVAVVSNSELPSHICGCCLLDLKNAVFHIDLFRDRCIKAQEQLLKYDCNEHASFSKCSSPLGDEFDDNGDHGDHIKLETEIDYDKFFFISNKLEPGDDVGAASCEFLEENCVSVLTDEPSLDADSLVRSVRNEIRSICDFSNDSQKSYEELQEYGKSDSDQNGNIKTSLNNNNNTSPTYLNYFPHKAMQSNKKITFESRGHDIPATIKPKKCYKSWKNLTEVEIIERKRQQRRRDCICDKCGRHFTDQSNFKLHLLRHTGVKNFKCKHCLKRFYTEHLLQLHERIVHLGERPYACKYCDKTFHNSTTRVIHERSHTNVRPYFCKYCEKTFISASGLKRHNLTHNGVRQFYCTICDKTFQRNTHLKAHLRSKLHGLREASRNFLVILE